MRVWMIGVLGLGSAMSVAGCSDRTNPRVVTRLNQDAALIGALPLNPLQGKVITSWMNRQDGTMSTMFGNDTAVEYVRTNAEAKYPVGSVVSVVTWAQQEDPRWFGGKIPERPKAVEIVTVTAPGASSYQRYEGTPLKRVATPDSAVASDRAAYLLSQRAAVMPSAVDARHSAKS